MITAPHELLIEDAYLIAGTFMRKAVTAIDESFGKGYAAKHPELVAAFMSSCSLDLAASLLCKEVAETVGEACTALTIAFG